MGKKKRGHPDVEEILARPWCYYCERDFDDLKILISHQKAKHFKCERCGRRLNTAGGLSVHLSQVHKETLTSVDNALPNRAGLDIEIFGMEGIPEDIMQTHRQRVLTQFHQAEADRRVATGNPPSGAGGQPGQTKKPKLESISEMKKRLAEHKAAKLAAEQGGSTPGSGTATPSEAAHGAQAQSPAGYSASPQFAGQQSFNNGAAPAASPSTFTPSYGQAPAPYQQPVQNFQPYQSAPQPYQSPVQPYQNSPQYSNPSMGGLPPQYQNGPPAGMPAGLPSNPSPSSYQPQFPPPATNTPPAIGSLPPRPGSLPSAPGLPQRPAFGAPQVNPHMMQQMHAGAPAPEGISPYRPQDSNTYQQPASAHVPSTVDSLISEAAAQADNLAKPSTPAVASTEDKDKEDKTAKKEKSKPTRLVFSDNEVSPEEKLARLSRYAFVPDLSGETVLGDATAAAPVTGAVRGENDVVDGSG